MLAALALCTLPPPEVLSQAESSGTRASAAMQARSLLLIAQRIAPWPRAVNARAPLPGGEAPATRAR